MAVIENEYLATLHLQAISSGLICCQYCCVALNVEHIVAHITHSPNHPRNTLPIDQEQLQKALKECNIPLQLPLPPVDYDIAPVPGLMLVDGWWCMHCRHASSTTGSMKKHQQSHKTIPVASRTSVQGPIQQLNSSNNSTWFRVHIPKSVPPLSKTSTAHLLEELQEALDDPEDLAASDGDDAVNISAWLRTCNWHIFTRELNVAKTRELVSLPTEPAMAVLVKAIELYMDNAYNLIDSTHPSIRKILNSENPLLK